ncbi:serine/threonine-protein kinase [Mariniblastus sp.]|nr:serine/threonine-protein kinase [Mariniblastus sp.]
MNNDNIDDTIDFEDHHQDLFDDLVDKFTQECRDGLAPSVDDYAKNNPVVAEQIREFFPAIEAIEIFGRVDDSQKRFQQATAKFDFERPTSIGDFKIVREIGRGGMGIVYEAIQQSLERPVAIKMLLRTSNEAKQIRRFEREAAIAAKLHHTNIVPVFGVGNQDQFYYYVMQLIDGVGFDQVIVALKNPSVAVPHPQLEKIAKWLPDVDSTHNGRYFRSVAKIAQSLAEALSYAHEQGTLHRDIKPANLLIDTTGHVWLADFGLAKAIESHDASRTGDVVGTLRYMSPEQFAGKPDHRSDIYALGLTIYELLTLQPAYDDASRSHLLFEGNQKNRAPKSPSKLVRHLPRDLETIVIKACSLDPELRYQTAADLEMDLDNFLLDRPIAARPPSTFENIYKWCKRNPAVAALSSLAFALLLIIAGLTSVAYVRANGALAKETEQRTRLEIEQRRSEALRVKTNNTLDISLNALDKIFNRLTPNNSATDLVSTIEDSDGQEITLRAPPILSAETATLLEEMLLVYDRLAKEDADDPRLQTASATAIARVGRIHQQLGALDKAASSFQAAIQRFKKIKGQEFETAKTYVALGNVFRNQQQQRDAEDAFKQAIELITKQLYHSNNAATSNESKTQLQIELARANYLLGKQQTNIIDRGPPPNVINTLAGIFGRRGLPQDRRNTDTDLRDYLNTAKSILLDLKESGKGGPDVRFLLALCYRDSRGKDGKSQREEAIETLRSLADDFPNNVDYQFELAEILSEPAPRSFLSQEDDDANLIESNAILEELAAQHPNIPRYRRLLSLSLNRLGMEQLHRINNRNRSKLPDVIELLDRSKNIQNQLVLEFPKSLELRYWLARLIGSYGESLTMAERYDDASDSFAEATSIAEGLIEDESTGVPALHLLIQLQRETERVYRKQGDSLQAKAARVRAESYHELLPPPPNLLDSLRR